MKTMTCNNWAGPCDVAHQGATADEVIKAQDRAPQGNGRGGDDDTRPAFKR